MAAHRIGPAGTTPPTQREAELQAEIERLQAAHEMHEANHARVVERLRKANDGLYRQAMAKELHAARKVIEAYRRWHNPHPGFTDCEVCQAFAAYDSLTGETRP